jgi:hypothetical protein
MVLERSLVMESTKENHKKEKAKKRRQYYQDNIESERQ